MDKLSLYKAKGYNFALQKKFKVLIAAYSMNEAMELANQFTGPDGWIESIKDTDEYVYMKGESEND